MRRDITRGETPSLRSCLIVPAQPFAGADVWPRCGAPLLFDMRQEAGVGEGVALMRRAKTQAEPPALYARVGLDNCEAALAALVGTPPAGVFLDAAGGGADVQLLSARIAVFEARADAPDGALAIVAEAAGAPAAVFKLASFAGCSPRLRALVFGRDALAQALGVAPDAAPVAQARSLFVLAAAAAEVPALDAPSLKPGDLAALREDCARARADGFSGKLAANPQELAVIAEVFGEVGR